MTDQERQDLAYLLEHDEALTDEVRELEIKCEDLEREIDVLKSAMSQYAETIEKMAINMNKMADILLSQQ